MRADIGLDYRATRTQRPAIEDCAWYRTRRIGPITIDLREKPIADLRRSARRLREMFDGVAV